MTVTIIRESNLKLMDRDIDVVENVLNGRFPDDYHRFLLEHNGGIPDPNMFLIPDHPLPGQSDLLDRFYCIDPDSPNHIVTVYKMYKGRVPAECLPIGTDPGGNQICLVMSGAEHGKIYFWDHENEADEDEEPTYRNMYLIADSFDDLLNNKLLKTSR